MCLSAPRAGARVSAGHIRAIGGWPLECWRHWQLRACYAYWPLGAATWSKEFARRRKHVDMLISSLASCKQSPSCIWQSAEMRCTRLTCIPGLLGKRTLQPALVWPQPGNLPAEIRGIKTSRQCTDDPAPEVKSTIAGSGLVART